MFWDAHLHPLLQVIVSWGYKHSGAGLDEQNLNKDVEQAIHDVFGSLSNTDSSSFVADSVGDMEQHANLSGSVAQDSVDQNVNCNHAKASDSSNEEVVKCTPMHVAQQHCLQDSAQAANNKLTALAHPSQLVASACQSSSLNVTLVIVKDLSSFPAVVQNDFKVLFALWAKQKDASTSKEDEQKNDNAADDGFTRIKSKSQKRECDMNLDGEIDREEFFGFIQKMTADTFNVVGQKLILTLVVAPTVAVATKRATEGVPGVGKVV